jgi:hypothetical protein
LWQGWCIITSSIVQLQQACVEGLRLRWEQTQEAGLHYSHIFPQASTHQTRCTLP